MAEIAVVHPDLSMRGGAESVCMHTLEALQHDHDLTLYTLSPPDIEALNDFFHTDVAPLTVRTAGSLGPALRNQMGHRLARLQAALLGRYCRRSLDTDVAVSTKNEFAFDVPSVEYVHSPQFASSDPALDDRSPVAEAYRRTCASLAGIRAEKFGGDRFENDGCPTRLLANSKWTAATVEAAYGADADAVYPPVAVDALPDRDWADREPGFLTVGRIGPSKNVLRNIEVIERVRDRGHEVHLHVVGPTTDGVYQREVKRAAAERCYIELAGAVTREELRELIASHRYGLHGRHYEHFGMAVAEFAAGGMIPFAPDSGGVVEILDDDQRLLYRSPDEAVEQLDRVLSDPTLQAALRERLQGVTSRFGRDTFRENVRSVVAEVLP